MTPANQQRFIDRLNQHPKLLERMEALLTIVENVGGDCTRADAAEQQVIDELRKMGSDALHCWAATTVDNAAEQAREPQPELHGNGKKKVCWHTTFGVISVIEPLLRCPGQQVRPFLSSAGISAQCCSMPLQRAMTDFGADHAFGQVPKTDIPHPIKFLVFFTY